MASIDGSPIEIERVFFTSDLHLGHVNAAVKHRGFSSVDEMNELIIRRWNERVGDGDQVFVLGDLCMGKIADSLELVSRLKGRITLIPGNHDRCSITHWAEHKTVAKRDAWLDWERVYLDAGVAEILHAEHSPGRCIEMKGVGYLSHYPPRGDHTVEERYLGARPTIPEGAWSVHGHVHDVWTVRGRMINVGIDVWDFGPVWAYTLQDVMGACELGLGSGA